ncbi:hypothetical protein ACB094_08G129200 [Castanea mollissima]
MACVSLFAFFLLSHLFLLHSAEEVNKTLQNCSPFQCGKFGTIGFPFTNISQPFSFLLPIKCDRMPPTIHLGLSRGLYEVINISYSYTSTKQSTRIKDLLLSDDLRNQKCESLTNFTIANSPIISFKLTTPSLTLVKCSRTLGITSPRNFRHASCGDYNLYYSHLNDNPPSFSSEYNDTLFSLLSAEFNLEMHVSDASSRCYGGAGQCVLDKNGKFQCAIAEKGLIGEMVVTVWEGKGSKKTLTHKSVEALLRNHEPHVIRRYKYSDIKSMTKSFKNKLGQGGYGCVYKGQLQDGCFVAVKVLKESKGNGEEFINKVASISRTSYVNIVTLKGFCSEGSKRALIYELMPNGSLEKFIYKGNPSNSNHQLGWETLYKISIDIARGLEYLHRGCNKQILHFDIKPHNILLDENFFPKISDFGLAKILGARGTTRYIAPEVFCRNFGGISHKSDVYSYGMMILEMVGGRKNVDVSVDFTSEIYFPHWIYKHLELNEELGLPGFLKERDEESARKMIIVSLWCIQTNPSNQPSMSRVSRVVEMLEGSLESLHIPPKPYLSSPSRSPIVN